MSRETRAAAKAASKEERRTRRAAAAKADRDMIDEWEALMTPSPQTIVAWPRLQKRFPGVTANAKIHKMGPYDYEGYAEEFWRVKFEGGGCPIGRIDSCWGDAAAWEVIEDAARQVLAMLPPVKQIVREGDAIH